MKNSYSFYNNHQCQYFPCHKVDDKDNFNCLFCFCPLYSLGDKCGGDFCYTDKGIKDCSNCVIPHSPESYYYIMDKLKEVK